MGKQLRQLSVLLLCMGATGTVAAGSIGLDVKPNPATTDEEIEIVVSFPVFPPIEAYEFDLTVDNRLIRIDIVTGDEPAVPLIFINRQTIGPLNPGLYSVQVNLFRGSELAESTSTLLPVADGGPVAVPIGTGATWLMAFSLVAMAFRQLRSSSPGHSARSTPRTLGGARGWQIGFCDSLRAAVMAERFRRSRSSAGRPRALPGRRLHSRPSAASCSRRNSASRRK